MEEQRNGRSAVADRAGEYRVSVEVLRGDWVADWYAEEVGKFVRLSGLRLFELSRLCALQVLEKIGAAMERMDYRVQWEDGRNGFVMNKGGVRVVVVVMVEE